MLFNGDHSHSHTSRKNFGGEIQFYLNFPDVCPIHDLVALQKLRPFLMKSKKKSSSRILIIFLNLATSPAQVVCYRLLIKKKRFGRNFLALSKNSDFSQITPYRCPKKF